MKRLGPARRRRRRVIRTISVKSPRYDRNERYLSLFNPRLVHVLATRTVVSALCDPKIKR